MLNAASGFGPNGVPPILQFGTGRFLQAHVDLFVSEAMDAGDALGGITAVRSTADAASAARLRALAGGRAYEVVVRGLVQGQPYERLHVCRSVREALDAREHWSELRHRVRDGVQVIVSNTGDAGWNLHDRDDAASLHPDAAAPASFPARLTVLLHDRWRARPDDPLTLLPCELLPHNGHRLRAVVASLARTYACDDGFLDWLQHHVVWANTLVDRIVSGALWPIGAIAEPYALWAIERQPRLVLPCRHPSIVVTDDLGPHERLKLFLLNLGHTALAQEWMRGDHGADMTVAQAMGEPSLRRMLEGVWTQEVLPVFDALGEGDAARAYLVELRDRLANPYLEHRLEDIARDHAQKKLRRIAPLVDLARKHVPALAQPRLRAVLAAEP
jgi:tagaturonate reductase